MTKHSPFRYFKTSPEVIRLAVMMYVRFPLSLRNVEDLLHERGVDVSHETVRSIRLFQNKPRDYPLCSNAVCLMRWLFRFWRYKGTVGGRLPARLLQRTSASISSSIEPPLSLRGVNYCAHRFRWCRQSDARFQ